MITDLVRLTDPVTLAGRTAQSRILFGPHETNLGHRRAFSPRHVAYYERRAAGGAGLVVTETASVHPSDWPYERAPLATDAEPGWRQVSAACHAHGALVLAGLGHAGLQGSSAYSQAALWAPAPFADPASREMPMQMEPPEIDALVAGFADAAGRAARAGADGVEVDAGPAALLRQFHSGLTNTRADGYGTDRLRLTREVLAAVRDAIGDRILALRLSCDELAPWAGVTPETAAGQARELSQWLDLLVVVRGGPYSASACRPDLHVEPMFNQALAGQIRDAVGAGVPVVLQGSVVDPAAAQQALDDGVCDLVEMTRAQIADAELASKVRAGQAAQVRPCLLCNQACRVRDSRNPLVSCVGDPRSGHETDDEPEAGTDAEARDVLVVGGGPAGLEAARVLALRGHRVRVAERAGQPGGALRIAAAGAVRPGPDAAGEDSGDQSCGAAPAEPAGGVVAGPAFGGVLAEPAFGGGRGRLARLTDWLAAECRRLGVRIDTGTEIGPDDLATAARQGTAVLLCTGSQPVPRFGDLAVDALTALRRGAGGLPDGPVVVHDPVGGPAGVAIAEWLAARGRQVTIVTPDPVAGTQLSLTGDLADANARLQRAGVTRELRSLLREAGGGRVLLEDVWTGARREISCAVLVDCGHRAADESLYRADRPALRAGDCIAPRTMLEAVLEGRRRALDIGRGALSPRLVAQAGHIDR